MAFGGRRGQRRARSGLGRVVLPTVLAGALLVTQACSPEVDRAHSLHTSVAGVPGVSDSDVTTPTRDRAGAIDVILDRGLDADDTLRVVRRVVAEADDAAFHGYVLEVRRSLVEDDVLVVDEAFPDQPHARDVVATWIRSVDALLGEVTYAAGAGLDDIEVHSGGGINHDVAEVSRIGHGDEATTWRFVNDTATFVVSGRVLPRDVDLFDRVQRTVVSSVLPAPASHWELQRREGHLLLDLEVKAAGEPEALTVAAWADDVEPLARAAVRATRYPGLDRWLQLSDVAGLGPHGETERAHSDADRDVFATWSSTGPPTKGRDRHVRGWDRWWFDLVR